MMNGLWTIETVETVVKAAQASTVVVPAAMEETVRQSLVSVGVMGVKARRVVWCFPMGALVMAGMLATGVMVGFVLVVAVPVATVGQVVLAVYLIMDMAATVEQAVMVEVVCAPKGMEGQVEVAVELVEPVAWLH